MVRHTRRSGPALPWRLVWLALGLIAFTALVALVAVALAAPAGAAAGTTTCPSSDRTQAISSRPGARSSLVPPGARQLLICRYSGLESQLPRPFTLLASALVKSPSEAQRVGRELNALPPPPPYAFCPADFGDALVVHVLYASGAGDPVTIELSGCRTVSNGLRTAWSGAVTTRLAALAPPPRQARLTGRVQVCGGPAPGTCRVETPTWCESTPTSCLKADRVAIVSDARARIVVALSDGRFGPVAVPPGRYTVELLGDNSVVRGHVLLTEQIALAAGETGTVEFGFDVP